MAPIQFIQIVLGLAVAGGGLWMMLRSAERPAGGGREIPRRPYIPAGTVAVGLIIAYRAFTAYETMDGQDLLITFVVVFGLLSLLALQFFVADRFTEPDEPVQQGADRPERESDGSWKA